MGSSNLLKRLLSRSKRKHSARPTRRLTSERLEQRALLATLIWDGEAGDGNWHSASNWFDETNGQNDVLPSTVDDVEIRSEFAADTVSITSANVTVNSLQSAAALTVQSNRTLTLSGTSQIDGEFTLSGNLAGTGTVNVTSGMSWNGGTMFDAGTTVIADTATLNISGNVGGLQNGRTLENFGQTNWEFGASAATISSSNIINRAGGVMELSEGVNFGGNDAFSQLINEGVVRKVGAATSGIHTIIHSSGTLDVQAGTLLLGANGGTISGGAVTAEGSTLHLFGGTYTIDTAPGKEFSGAGRLLIERSLGVVNFVSNTPVSNLDFVSGAIGGTGIVTITGSMNWSGGRMREAGTTVIGDTGSLSITGDSVRLADGRTLENLGQLTWQTGSGASSITNSTIINRAGGVMELSEGVNFGGNDAFSQLINEGVVRKVGAGTSGIHTVIHSSGTLDVQAGTLLLGANGGTISGDAVTADGSTLHLFGGTYTVDTAPGKEFSGAGRLLIERSLGVVNFVSNTPVSNLDFVSGAIGGTGVVTITNSMNWSGGTMREGGTTIIGGTGSLSITGSSVQLTNGRTLENFGQLTWQTGSGASSVTNSTLINRAGGLFEVSGDVRFGGNDSDSRMVNEGVLRKIGADLSGIYLIVESSGTLDVQAGTLEIGTSFSGNSSTISGDVMLAADAVLRPVGSHTVNQPDGKTFSGNGTLLLDGAGQSIVVVSNSQIPNLDLRSGGVHGTGTLTVTDSMSWTGGVMADAGRTVIASSAGLTIGGGPLLLGGRIVENFGQMTWQPSSRLSNMVGSTIINRFSGLMEVADGVQFGGNDAVSRLVNEGIVRKAGTTSAEINTIIESPGTLDVQGGTLQLGVNGGTIGGDVLFSDDAALALIGPYAIDQQPGRSFFGDGTLLVNRFSADVRFESDTDVPNLDFLQGSLGGAGVLNITNHMNWQTGALEGSGTTVIADSATLEIEGPVDSNGTRRFENFGAVVLRNGSLRANQPSSIVNHAGSVFEIAGDASIDADFSFDNHGALIKSAGSGVAGVGAPLVNTGSVESHSGTLRIYQSGSNFTQGAETSLERGTWRASTNESAAASATLQLDGINPINIVRGSAIVDGQTASLSNDSDQELLTGLTDIESGGVVSLSQGYDLSVPAADLRNDGTLTLGEQSELNADGTYTQTADGSLVIQLGGAPASGDFGQLNVLGDADLAGKLAVEFVDGFGPIAGYSWQVMSYANRIGDFDEIDVPLLGQEPSLDVVRGGADVVVNALISASDLQVAPDSVVIPLDSVAGQDTNIQYTIDNLSETVAEGGWVDSIYLSEDAVLDASDLLLARHPHVDDLPGLSTTNVDIDVPLPANFEGFHRVLVVADSRGMIPDSNRSNNFQISTLATDVSVPSLAVGESVDIPIDQDQAVYYRIDVPYGEDVSIVAELASQLQAEVFASRARIPTRSDFDLHSRATGDELTTHVFDISNQGGTWYLLVHGGFEADGSALNLSADIVGLQLNFVRGKLIHKNVGEVTLGLIGTGFSPDSIPLIVAPDNSEIAAKKFAVRSSNEIRSVFDFAGLTPGSYKIRVDDGDQSATGAFNLIIQEGGEPGRLVFEAESTERTRIRGTGDLELKYKNVGDTDVAVPILQIRERGFETPIVLLPPELGDNSFGYNTGRLAVQILDMDGIHGGIVPPGWSGVIRLDFRTVQSSPSPPLLKFEVFSPFANLDAPIKYDRLTEDLRPERVSEEAWSVIVQNLRGMLGETLGDFQNTARETLDYLASVGNENVTVDDLMGFLMSQADGSLPKRPVAAAQDVSLSTNGFPLTFSRVLSNSIADRYENGILGRGWTHNLDMTLRLVSTQEEQFPDLPPQQDSSLYTPRKQLELTTPSSVRVFNAHVLELRNQLPTYSYRETGTRAKSPEWASPINVFRIIEPDGTILRFEGPETPLGRRLSEINDSHGNTVSLQYAADLLTLVEHSDGSSFSLFYNGDNQLERIAENNGREVVYTYDPSGEQLLTVNRPDGTLAYTYVSGMGAAREHALETVTGTDGVTVRYHYDDQGRVSGSEGPGGIEPVSVDYVHGQITIEDADEHSIQLFYDVFGRLARSIDPLGETTSFDFLDRDITSPHTQSGTENETTGVRVQLPGNRTIEVDDGQGVPSVPLNGLYPTLRIIDTAGHQVVEQFSFAKKNFPDADFTVAELSDLQPREIIDELGRSTTFQYNRDVDGSLASITYPDGAVERFPEYDDAGNALSYINRRGQSVQLTYDDKGQLTRQDHADDSFEQFTYDPEGRLLTATDENGTVTFVYDAAGRPLSVDYPNGRSLAYAYNAIGQLISITDQDGNATKYTYDVAGRLDTLRDANDDLIVDYTYDTVGRLGREDRGNGSYSVYAHDAASQLTNITHHAPDDSVRSRFDYQYDELGRRTQMDTLDGVWTYKYSPTGALIAAKFTSANPELPNQDLNYQYDAAGNRVRTIRNNVVTDYAINDRNQFTTVGSAAYTYDADGNLVEVDDGGEVTEYSYDDEDRLVGVTNADGTWTYEYDVLGHRTATIHDGQRTEYLLDPFDLETTFAEYDADGNLVAHYAHGLGLEARSGGGEPTLHYDFDGTGSTVGLVDPSGDYVNEYRYLPFGGNLGTPTETVSNSFEFVGEYGIVTEDNGLHQMRARFYSGQDGRFVNEDPIGFAGGRNLYRYALNDSINYVDPSGNAPFYVAWKALRTKTGRKVKDITEGVIKIAEDLLPDHPHAKGLAAKEKVRELDADGIEYILTKGAREAIEELDEFEKSVTAITQNPFFGGASKALKRISDNEEIFTIRSVTSLLSNFNPVGAAFAIYDVYRQFKKSAFWGNWLCDLTDCDDTRALAESGTIVIGSSDPNDIIGPTGFGESRFIGPNFPLSYRARFENIDTATAPAAEVRVTQQLDTDLDWNSVELGNVGFGSFNVDVPEGRTYYKTRVDATETLDVLVDVEGEVNPLTGLLQWTFTALDPNTLDIPIDPRIGFLPPNLTSPQGEGYVSYTASLLPDLPTGTTIDAEARIFFDLNDPIDTPVWTNTIDAAAPDSSVDALPTETRATSLPISWSGSDDAGGSGIVSYDLYLSVDGADFELLVDDSTETSTIVPTEVGRTYAFYTIATDNAGHVEQAPGIPDAVTTIIPNTTPVADAGPDQGGEVSDLITLDGSGSSDAEIDPLTYAWSFVSLPVGSTATLSDPTTVDPSFTLDIAGTYLVQLIVNDGFDDSAPDTVTIAAAVSNVAPVANDDDYPLDEDNTLTIPANGVLANDTDGDGDTLIALLVQTTTNGSLNLSGDGSFVYTSDADFVGDDTFIYQAHDGELPSNMATVTIEVGPVNDPPSLTIGGEQNVDEDSGPHSVANFASALPGGGADEVGQTFTYNVSNDNASLFSAAPTIDPSGTLTYSLATNANGTAAVTVSVTDSGGGDDTSSSQAFDIVVAAVNDEPIVLAPISDISTSVGSDSRSIDLSGVFLDVEDGGELNFAAVSSDGNVVATSITSGVLSLEFGTDTGQAEVTVTATDSGGASITDTFGVQLVEAASINAPDAVVPQQSFSISALFAGRSGDGYSAVIDWGDGSADAVAVNQQDDALQVTGSHAYQELGEYTIRVDLADNDGNVVSAQTEITVERWLVADDPTQAGMSIFSVGGTNGADRIRFWLVDQGTRLRGAVNGQTLVELPLSQISRIEAYGGGHHDLISVAKAIELPTLLVGGQGNDVIIGGGGPDHIDAGAGRDSVFGRRGDDLIDAGDDQDFVFGGPGDDQIDGGDGNDRIFGNGGDDTILAGLGDDRVNAGRGDDVVDGAGGRDALDGSTGDDLIRGGENNDLIRGGFGDDELRGGPGDDRILGNFGDDLLVGGPGTDTLVGGSGNDTEIQDDEPPSGSVTEGEFFQQASVGLDLQRDHDVNGDGRVSALDALSVINQFARAGRPGSAVTSKVELPFDINRDGRVSALDALSVINWIDRRTFDQSSSGTLWDQLERALDEEAVADADEKSMKLESLANELADALSSKSEDEEECAIAVDRALAELELVLAFDR